jgi:hypothetical protein
MRGGAAMRDDLVDEGELCEEVERHLQ